MGQTTSSERLHNALKDGNWIACHFQLLQINGHCQKRSCLGINQVAGRNITHITWSFEHDPSLPRLQ